MPLMRHVKSMRKGQVDVPALVMMFYSVVRLRKNR